VHTQDRKTPRGKMIKKIDRIYYHCGYILWIMLENISKFVYAICRGLRKYCSDRRDKYTILKIKGGK